jgi:hypothetical protein
MTIIIPINLLWFLAGFFSCLVLCILVIALVARRGRKRTEELVKAVTINEAQGAGTTDVEKIIERAATAAVSSRIAQ